MKCHVCGSPMHHASRNREVCNHHGCQVQGVSFGVPNLDGALKLEPLWYRQLRVKAAKEGVDTLVILRRWRTEGLKDWK